MKRTIALAAVAVTALVGGFSGGAAAEPTTETTGCQTVATKYTQPDAPGHHGVYNAAGQEGPGEGPCGFGEPPRGG